MKKETQNPTKKSGIFFKLFTIIIMIMALVLIYIEHIMHKFVSKAKPEEKAYVMNVHIENGENVPATEHNAQLDVLEKELNDRISVEVSEDFSIKASLAEKMDHYRIELMQVTRLIEKLSRGEDYSKELEFLSQNNNIYPTEISSVFTSLADYKNKYLTSADTEYKKLSIEGNFVTKIFNKIVHIEQKNPNYEARMEEYNKLKNTTHILEDYFYSKEFLKKYLSND